MVCRPLSSSDFSVPTIPGIGLSIPLPDLNIPFPDIPLNDLTDLFNKLGMLLPPGNLKPNLDSDVFNDVMQAVNDILRKFLPFLMLYKFLLPILNLILCIIEVLCSLSNPIKTLRALRRLFRVCIPEFLALFPFFALIAMIIALLLLILALIEYLINRILGILKRILANIILLSKAASRLDNDSILGIVKKIGDLLCLMQNLFVIFGVILLIIQLIKAMLGLGFRIPPCDSSDGSSDGCCTPDVCPSFIKNNTDITSSTGNFLYFNQVGIDSGLILPVGFPPIVSTIRSESWQFYDPNLSQSQAFINITNAFDLPSGTKQIFFPSGATYNATTNPSSTPYTITFDVLYNPTTFGRIDPKGIRLIKIKDAIVQAPPTNGLSSFDGHTFVAPFNGVLNLIGGSITEEDGTVINDPNGNPFTIGTLFHLPINNNGAIPHSTDSVLFSNISYTFTIHHEVLFGNGLITAGCIPSVAADRDFINTTIGTQFNLNGQNLSNIVLPDMLGAQECITNSINIFRNSLSVESTAIFQASITTCLNNLKTDTSNALTAAIIAGFDQFKSDFTLDTPIQFTTLPIKVSAALNESSGNSMTNGIPVDVAASLATHISGKITLGNLSPFVYDGYQLFVADLTSSAPGNGTIEVAFDNKFISILNNPTNIDQSPSVSVKTLAYTFVQSGALTGEPRRDVEDVSADGKVRTGE